MNGYWIKFKDGTSGYCDGIRRLGVDYRRFIKELL